MAGGKKCHPWSSNDFVTIFRPGAFFFHAGRLYIGYGWLSSFHVGEGVMWDPVPVPLGAAVETCRGYFHFLKILEEGPPYFRKYAVLALRQTHYPDDFGDGFLKKKIRQGVIHVREQFVLPSHCYFEVQWGSGGGHACVLACDVKEELAWQKKEEAAMRGWERERHILIKKGVATEDLPKQPNVRPAHPRLYSMNLSLCHKWRRDGQNLERKILRSAPLTTMREHAEAKKFRAQQHPKGHMACGQ